MVRFNGFRLLSIFLTPVTESEHLNTERGSGIDLSGGQICVAMRWSFFLSDAIPMFFGHTSGTSESGFLKFEK